METQAEKLIREGRELWAQGKLAKALSKYNEAAALDPDGPGKALADQARDVLDFFNPDLLNP